QTPSRKTAARPGSAGNRIFGLLASTCGHGGVVMGSHTDANGAVGMDRHGPWKILFPADPGRAAVFRDGFCGGATSFSERLAILLPDRGGFHIRSFERAGRHS